MLCKAVSSNFNIEFMAAFVDHFSWVDVAKLTLTFLLLLLPVMENVFPDPVCPYAKIVPLNPLRTLDMTGCATLVNTSSCWVFWKIIIFPIWMLLVDARSFRLRSWGFFWHVTPKETRWRPPLATKPFVSSIRKQNLTNHIPMFRIPVYVFL